MSTAERCAMSGRRQSVPWDEWADAETVTCLECGHVVKWRSRATDTPPWGKVMPHRVDGSPCR